MSLSFRRSSHTLITKINRIKTSSSSPSHSFRITPKTIRPFVSMVKDIRVHELGRPEVLKWEEVEIGDPKEGEIRVKNKALGLNFIDVYYCKGVYQYPLPFIPDCIFSRPEQTALLNA